MSQQELAAMLEGGDRRSIGRADEVARLVIKQPRRFRELIKCLWDENPVLRMRAADAAEKVSAKRPRLLDRHKLELLGLLAEADQIELRWHLAAMIPRLRLTPLERQRAAATLERYLDHSSSIVKTFALQALSDLSQQDGPLRTKVKRLLEDALQSGTPAMRARARHLLKQFPAWANFPASFGSHLQRFLKTRGGASSAKPLSLTHTGRGEYPFKVAARLETPAALSRKTAQRLTSLLEPCQGIRKEFYRRFALSRHSRAGQNRSYLPEANNHVTRPRQPVLSIRSRTCT